MLISNFLIMTVPDGSGISSTSSALNQDKVDSCSEWFVSANKWFEMYLNTVQSF